MDAQGADKARPYVEKAGAEFTTVVDEENLLAQLYGFKAIPNGFLIDEQGIVRYKELGGFDIRRAETTEVVERWVGGLGPGEPAEETDSKLEAEHSQAKVVALPDENHSQAKVVALPDENHSQANAYFRRGVRLLQEGRVPEAIAEWRKGVELEPDNYLILKQIWAVENPDRFYAGSVDSDWQREQRAKGL